MIVRTTRTSVRVRMLVTLDLKTSHTLLICIVEREAYLISPQSSDTWNIVAYSRTV